MEKVNDMEGKSRIVALDYIRVLAIFCVILTHATERVYTLNVEAFYNEVIHARLSGLIFFTIGRLGVPLFLFLTGYLMLDRVYNQENTVSFWKKRVGGMCITTEIWIIIYYFFAIVFWGRKFSALELMEQLLFVKQANCPHLWYMPTILGLYIFIPFVANAINIYDMHIFTFPILIAVLYLFVPTSINVICMTLKQDFLIKTLDLSFAGGGVRDSINYWLGC